MSGLRRPVLWMVGGAIILAAAFLAFRIPLFEAAGRAGLSLAGFKDVSLAVSEISMERAHIAKLAVGDELTVRDVTLRYRPLDLLRGHIVAVDIGDLRLDLSAPEEGTIRRLRDLLEEGETKAEEDTGFAIPAVSVKNGEVVYASDGRSATATLTGVITPERMLQGEASLAARIETADGAILLEGIRLTVAADLERLDGGIVVAGGEVRRAAAEPDWEPFQLTGKADLAAGLLSGGLTLGTPTGRELVALDGRYDVSRASGEAALSVRDLTFRKDGFQPADLSRRAADIPPFDGVLSISAKVIVEARQIAYQAEVDLAGFSMTLPEAEITAETIPLRLAGEYRLDDGNQEAEITLPASDVEIAYQGGRYALHALQGRAMVRDFGAMIDIAGIDGRLSDLGKTPDFAPLAFALEGRLEDARDLAIKGRITGPSAFSFDTFAVLQLPEAAGVVSLSLPKTRIGKGGVALADISRHLAAIGTLSGSIEATLAAERHADGRIDVTALTATIEEGAWRRDDIALAGVSLAISDMEEANAATLLSGKIDGRIAAVTFGDQTVAVPSIAGTVALSSDGDGRLDVTDLRVRPEAGAIFREEQRIRGNAQLAGGNVEFIAVVSSDLLGTSYARVTGRHALARSRGEAAVKIEPLTFAKDGVQPAHIINLAMDMTLDGVIAPAATLSWSGDGLSGSADMTFEGVTAGLPAGEITGLRGTVHVDELFPLTIATAQEISAAAATAGLPLASPHLRFRLLTEKGNPVLYIDRMTVGLVGGSAIIEGAKIDTGAEVNRLDVQLSHLDLEEVMELTTVEELVAMGHVSGRIPLIFGGERLIVEDGELSADGPGVLKMSSEAARAALGVGGEQAQLVLDILENFQYSELSIAISKTESGEDTVKLHAAGSNPNVENNRPVVLNINLETSLDKIFNAVLDGYLLSEKALRATVGNR